MDRRITFGVGAGLGLASSAMIQLTDINRLFLLCVLGLGIFIIVWELAPFIADLVGVQHKAKRTMLPTLVMMLGVILFGAGAVWYYVEHPKVTDPPLVGARGGDATVEGSRSGAIGGDAGERGLLPGGRGGDATVRGDNSYARGGSGGNAPLRPDGRGGRRTKSPGELENLPTAMWPYGYGGRGANDPEYDRRLRVLTQIREEYMKAFPDDVVFIQAGIDQVPISWVNKRLEEIGEIWRVELVDGGYVLPPLPSSR